jgi:hypothetical protein
VSRTGRGLPLTMWAMPRSFAWRAITCSRYQTSACQGSGSDPHGQGCLGLGPTETRSSRSLVGATNPRHLDAVEALELDALETHYTLREPAAFQ